MATVICFRGADTPRQASQCLSAYMALVERRYSKTLETTATDEQIAASVPAFKSGENLKGAMTGQTYRKTLKGKLKEFGLVDYEDGRRSRTATVYTFPALKRLLDGSPPPDWPEGGKAYAKKGKRKPPKGGKSVNTDCNRYSLPTTNTVLNGSGSVQQLPTYRVTEKDRVSSCIEEGSSISSPQKQNHHVSGQSAPSCPNCQRPLSHSWKSGGLEWWDCPCGWHGNLSEDIPF